jgi:predicted  nucleic acid-binding Zn-ribbon protein
MGLVELLVLLAAVAGSSGIVGSGAWLWYRTKRLEERMEGRGSDAPHLAMELDDLRNELAASNEDVRYLRERLDFLERLLSSGETEPARELTDASRSEEADAQKRGK